MPATWKIALAAASALVLYAGVADAAGGPSFSCRGRLNRAERLICNDSELAQMDRKVNRLYRDLGGANGADDDVRDYVREALAERNDCTSASCIRRVLRDEIAYLSNVDSGGDY